MKRLLFLVFSGQTIIFILTGFASCEQDSDKSYKLSVSPESIEFEASGGSKSLYITSDTYWTLSGLSEWYTVSDTSSEGNDTITITAKVNSDTFSRSEILFITANELEKEVLITQKGFVFDSNSYDIPPDSSSIRDLTCIELAQEMKVGWNVGNSLEATWTETAWGNPKITQLLIDSVHAAGFNAIRIPVAWSKFSDESTFTIKTSWMERVEEVVNYVLNRGMYAIINIHWDGGWIQPTYEQEDYVNKRLAAMWKQIAIHFRNYDDHLLFAGTNEVMKEGDWGRPTKEYYTVQNGYNQTFVTTVRYTGGRNVYRHLVVQGFNTNIDYTVSYAVMPTDVVKNRLMMEVHYYDPYNFTLNKNSNITQWGKNATDPSRTETWANETWADEQFQKMKTNFVDKGIAVILGEYGAIARLTVSDHAEYRRYYVEYITKSIVDHELIPFYWDNGYITDNELGIFNRNTGRQAYPDILEAVINAVE